MNVTARTCVNCATFNHRPEGDEPRCWDLITFTDRVGTPTERTREPIETDTCPEHKSAAEDAFEDLIINNARESGGLAAACAAADACAIAHTAIRRAAQV